jgi:hypothetical protein
VVEARSDGARHPNDDRRAAISTSPKKPAVTVLAAPSLHYGRPGDAIAGPDLALREVEKIGVVELSRGGQAHLGQRAATAA